MVLSSPSGGGKTSIAQRLVAARSDVQYSVSATTRSQRDGETEGQSYCFLSRPDFEREVAAGAFLEWAEYGGNLYGTLKREVLRGRAAGRHVVLDIEVKGADQLRLADPESVRIFVLPPSGAELIKRLEGRRTESEAAIARRLAIASDEVGAASRYDYVVINDDLTVATAQVGAIIDVECRRPARLKGLDPVIAELRLSLANRTSGLNRS